MEREYVKDMLEDIKKLAENSDFIGIIAMCNNEIETIEQRTLKQDAVDAVKVIEDAKYELIRLRIGEDNHLYEMLDNASKLLRNLAIKIELISDLDNQD